MYNYGATLCELRYKWLQVSVLWGDDAMLLIWIIIILIMIQGV